MTGKMVKPGRPVKGEMRFLFGARSDAKPVTTFADRAREVPAGRYFSSQSAQRAGSLWPHGMIGTVEVEFFGEPSMILSE